MQEDKELRDDLAAMRRVAWRDRLADLGLLGKIALLVVGFGLTLALTFFLAKVFGLQTEPGSIVELLAEVLLIPWLVLAWWMFRNKA